MNDIIYFDNAATTPLIEQVKSCIVSSFDNYANPSSLHAQGFEAHTSLERTRNLISGTLGAHTVVFTASGSEANNLAILSGAEKNRRAGNRIITTDSEHPSVEQCCRVLEQKGFDVVRLSTLGGKINMEQLEKALDEPVCLVSVMHTNNETGAIYPIREISSKVKKRYPRALIHSDCVQAFLKDKFTMSSLGVDMISVSAHKIHALKGVGALAFMRPLSLKPIIFGGGQEKGLRSGTENTVGISSMGAAVEAALSDNDRTEKAKKLSDKLTTFLSCVDGIVLNVPEHKSPYIVNFSATGVRSETLLHSLSSKGIFVSSGSACSSKAKLSSVLLSFGLDKSLAESAVRVSFSSYNTEKEVEIFVRVLKEEYTRLGGKNR